MVLVSEGSERVKTATLSFQLNQVLSDLLLIPVQSSPKRTFTKGGEYNYHTFGYNQLHSDGTLQVFALVYFSYGEQHCITSPVFLSIRNNLIPPQLLQITAMVVVMRAPNLNVSMLFSQHAATMIPMYEVMQTPLSCYGNLLYFKQRLAIYYSLLKRSLRFSYGQHDHYT